MSFLNLSLFATCANADKCHVEVVQVQDYSNFMDEIVNQLKDFATYKSNLVKGFNSVLSGSPESVSFGLTSFVDKPVPFLGFGWGPSNASVYEDWCYQYHLPLTKLRDLPNSVDLPYLAGGDDFPENQFEAMLASASDSRLNWTSGNSKNGERLFKFTVLVTDSVAHGANVAGQYKYPDDSNFSTVVWPTSNGLTTGNDFWYAINTYNASWGREHEVYTNTTSDPYLVSLRDEFIAHQNCAAGSDGWKLYSSLSRIEDKTPEQEARWKDVMEFCGPADIASFLNISTVDVLLDRKHPGGVDIPADQWYRFEKGGDLCSYYEYPTHEQVEDFYNQNSVIPIVIVAKKKEAEIAHAPWLQYAYGTCREDLVDTNCVSDFYLSLFPDAIVIKSLPESVATTVGSTIAEYLKAAGCEESDDIDIDLAPPIMSTDPASTSTATSTTTTSSTTSTTTTSTTTITKSTSALPETATGYHYNCSDITSYEWELLDLINEVRKPLGVPLVSIGQYAQRTAKLKVHDVSWAEYHGKQIQCESKSMHSWAAYTETNIFTPCCYSNNYNTPGASPSCMHFIIRETSEGKLANAAGYEITAGYSLSDCYSEDLPPVQNIHTPEGLLNLWLSSPYHSAVIRGDDYWNKPWNSIGIGMGPCRSAVWFIENGPDEIMCSRRSAKTLNTELWWEQFPLGDEEVGNSTLTTKSDISEIPTLAVDSDIHILKEDALPKAQQALIDKIESLLFETLKP